MNTPNFNLRISEDLLHNIDAAMSRDMTGMFTSRSHFIRCAIIKYLRELETIHKINSGQNVASFGKY